MFRWLPVLVLSLTGCGLFGPENELGFREYTLRGTSYEEAAVVVHQVTLDVFRELFGGGFNVDWDPLQGNLQIEEIYEGNRRLNMYIKVFPRGDDTIVEMFAHVQTLTARLDGFPEWSQSQQDVPLEEKLYRAYIEELVDRRAEG